MQILVSIIYLSTAAAKLRGDTWQNGTAVAYTLRLDDMLVLPVPWFVSDTPLIANALTWATLLTGLSIGLLVWNKRWRARVLFAGVRSGRAGEGHRRRHGEAIDRRRRTVPRRNRTSVGELPDDESEPEVP